MSKGKNGITLIALIITIIIMLILVGVTVSVAIQGGLFSTARKAVTKTEEAKREEISGRMQIGGVWYDSIEAYLNNEKSSNQTGIITKYEEPKDGEVLAENAIFTDSAGTAVIPKGFKIVNGIENTQSIEKGLVIQDAEGNEFVWIPVNYTPTGKVDENGLDEGFKEVFHRINWESDSHWSDYTEPYEEGYEGEIEEYYEMMRSVQTNRGFYIGRYEAGSVETRILDQNNPTTTMVVKRDQYPYSGITWGASMDNYEDDITDYYFHNTQGKGAVYLSKHLYDNKNVGVVPTLCYGVQWDGMLDFIKNTKDVTNSTSWGNYSDSEFTINRETAKYYIDMWGSESKWSTVNSEGYEKENNNQVLLTTGASDIFAAKNIYDVAGNCWELTMESTRSWYRVIRGGSALEPGSGSPARCRYADIMIVTRHRDLSFRPTLYINN